MVGCVAILLLILRLLIRNWYRAGLMTSLVVILFSTYGHVYHFLQQTQAGAVIGQANVLAAIWATLLILLGWGTIRILKDPIPINEFFNLASIFLIIFSAVKIANFYFHASNQTVSEVQPPNEALLTSIKPVAKEQLPDIYYIVLDEYGRSDVLQEIMGYDNSEFIQYLQDKGFYVAEQSRANYAITLMSLASSLNSTYLNDQVSPDPQNGQSNTNRMVQMINENSARSFFTKAGYRFVSIASGYSFTEFTDADIYYQPASYINDFEMVYLDSTLFSLEMDRFQEERARSLFLNAFSRLENMPEVESDHPKFVFAHIMAGHVPFVFQPDGEDAPMWTFSVSPNARDNSERTYTSAYMDQVTYANRLLETTIDAILAKSKIQPIIILQGDHGPESRLDWYSVDHTCLKERMSILNAYYLPDFDRDLLYPSITPVNTFRLIDRYYFGVDESLLEDRSYFSLWDRSYDYIDVTQSADSCSAR